MFTGSFCKHPFTGVVLCLGLTLWLFGTAFVLSHTCFPVLYSVQTVAACSLSGGCTHGAAGFCAALSGWETNGWGP